MGDKLDQASSGAFEVASGSEWRDPPTDLLLSRSAVHVWKVELDQRDQHLHLFESTLSQDELARAARFQFERDRRRFVAARGQLRTILARYLKVEPDSLEFSYGSNGKPFLAGRFRTDGLRFNLAHSAALALAAVSRDREIGVDLEEMRRLDNAEQIAGRFFSQQENEALRAHADGEKLEAFYRCWTCKEAYLKAAGEGLRRPTASFDVAFGREELVRLLAIDGESENATHWSLVVLAAPTPGFVGALAVEGHAWTLSCWRFQPRAMS